MSARQLILNSTYASLRAQFSILFQQGVPLQTVAHLAQDLQICVHRSYIQALQDAGIAITGDPRPYHEPELPPNGTSPKPPEDMSDFNPFI